MNRNCRLPRLVLPQYDMCLTTMRFYHDAGCFSIYKFKPWLPTMIITKFITDVSSSMMYIFRQLYKIPCKVQLSMKLRFVKTELDEGGCPITLTKLVITNEKQCRIFNDEDVNDYMQTAFDRFDKFINDWSEHGSGWQLEEIVNMNIRVSLVKIICGSGTVKLPPALLAKKAVLNIDSPDGQCFQYAVVAALHHNDLSVDSRS